MEKHVRRESALILALALCRGVVFSLVDGEEVDPEEALEIFNLTSLESIAKILGIMEDEFHCDWHQALSREEVELLKGILE